MISFRRSTTPLQLDFDGDTFDLDLILKSMTTKSSWLKN